MDRQFIPSLVSSFPTFFPYIIHFPSRPFMPFFFCLFLLFPAVSSWTLYINPPYHSLSVPEQKGVWKECNFLYYTILYYIYTKEHDKSSFEFGSTKSQIQINASIPTSETKKKFLGFLNLPKNKICLAKCAMRILSFFIYIEHFL